MVGQGKNREFENTIPVGILYIDQHYRLYGHQAINPVLSNLKGKLAHDFNDISFL